MKKNALLLIGILVYVISFSQNNSPVAVPDSVSVLSQEPVTVEVLLNDYDKEVDIIYIDIEHNPDLPIANPDSVDATAMIPATFYPLENDSDPLGDSIVIKDVDILHAQGLLNYTDTSITYTPYFNNSQKEIIRYRIKKKNLPEAYSDWASIYINVSVNTEYFQAINDYYTVMAGMPIEFNVLKNDLNPTNDSIELWMAKANHGSARKINDSTIRYISYMNYSGIDSVEYIITFTSGPIPFSKAYSKLNVQNNYSFRKLNINNVNAGVNSRGLLFGKRNYIDFQKDYFEPSYEVPANSGKHTIFCTRFWIYGMDDQNELHGASERYNQVGYDFHVGPIANDFGTNFLIKWRKIWKLNKSEVEYHKANWWKTGYTAIGEILTWPGNGDVSNGEAEIIAPFFDKDNNGIYEPMQGDYPIIRGDQTLFFVMNDNIEHTESKGNPMKVEVHMMVYGFDLPDDTIFWNSTFVHMDVFNRSDQTYYDCYAGCWSDFDLGYAWDDYMGCNVELGYMYTYNGYDIDGNGEPGTYGADPPVQSIAILGGPYLDPDGIDNPRFDNQGLPLCDESINGLNFGDSIVDNERLGMTGFMYHNNDGGNQGDPNIATDYYNYLRSYWKDNTKMLYGGNAHMTSGAVGPECNFMFPGDSDTCNWGTGGVVPNGGFNQNGYYWTEETVGNNPNDRRGLASMGPFTFQPNQKHEIDLALAWTRDTIGNGIGGSLNLMKEYIKALRRAFILDSVPNGSSFFSISERRNTGIKINIYPNPARDVIFIRFEHILKEGYYQIYSFNGQLCLKGEIKSSNQFMINTSNLKPGLHVLVIYSGNGITSRKFIIL